MKDQFVPYELALKLKELGFKEPCLGFFIKDRLSYPFLTNNETYLRAPLWQQAFDWFSEEYKINNFTYRYIDGQWCFEIFRDDFSDCWEMYSSTKGEARQACLEKLIELCKKN